MDRIDFILFFISTISLFGLMWELFKLYRMNRNINYRIRDVEKNIYALTARRILITKFENYQYSIWMFSKQPIIDYLMIFVGCQLVLLLY